MNLTKCIIDPLLEINKEKKLIAKNYDCTNVISRTVGDVQAKIREIYQNAYFVHTAVYAKKRGMAGTFSIQIIK